MCDRYDLKPDKNGQLVINANSDAGKMIEELRQKHDAWRRAMQVKAAANAKLGSELLSNSPHSIDIETFNALMAANQEQMTGLMSQEGFSPDEQKSLRKYHETFQARLGEKEDPAEVMTTLWENFTENSRQ